MTLCERTFDSQFMNYILNHESVTPNTRQDSYLGWLDSLPIVKNPNNVIFKGEHGLISFIPREGQKGVYDGDAMILPQGRGRSAFEFTKEALRRMFQDYGAERVIAEIPVFNKASQMFVRKLGFSLMGIKKNAWLRKGQVYDANIFELEHASSRGISSSSGSNGSDRGQ